MRSGTHGDKRFGNDPLDIVQQRNRGWWERTPMTYDWNAGVSSTDWDQSPPRSTPSMLLGFFDDATVGVEGLESDVLPLPRGLRHLVMSRLPARRASRMLARWGSFVTFDAARPLRP